MKVKRQESTYHTLRARGLVVLTMISLVSVGMAVVTLAIGAVNLSISKAFRGEQDRVRRRALAYAAFGVGGFLVEETLQRGPFLREALDKWAVETGEALASLGVPHLQVVYEDEEAKLSMAGMVWAAGEVALACQLPTPPVDLTAARAAWKNRLEAVEELIGHGWPLTTDQMARLRACFTAVPSRAINVNTASDEVFEGVWHWAAMAAGVAGHLEFQNSGWPNLAGSKTVSPPTALIPQTYLRGTPMGSPSDRTDALDAGPFQAHELTQPVGVFWFDPSQYYVPFSPDPLGKPDPETFEGFELGDLFRPGVMLNTLLNGFLSLQGPGPYRATSEHYTLSLSKAGASSGAPPETTLRVTWRTSPDGLPRVLRWEEE